MTASTMYDTKQFFRPLLPIGAELCNYTIRIMSTVRGWRWCWWWSMVSWSLKRDGIAKGPVAQPYPWSMATGFATVRRPVLLPPVIRRSRPVAFLNWKNITRLSARQKVDVISLVVILKTIFVDDSSRYQYFPKRDLINSAFFDTSIYINRNICTHSKQQVE